MKKYFALIFLGYCLPAMSATVRIYNKSKEPIFALINDQTSVGINEETKTRRETLAAFTFGISAAIDAASGSSKQRANVKRINPKESRFFNSDFEPINKVTFFKFGPPKTYTTKENSLWQAVVSEDNPHSQAQKKALKEYGYATKIKSRFDEKTGLFTFEVPTVEKFTINPDIDPLTTEAKIDYFGWKNAKRIKRKFLGIF